MNRTFTSLLAGAAMLAATGAAQAAVISGGTASISSTLTDYNTTLGTLNKFDSTLGTLTQVSFTVSYGFNSTITVVAATAATGSTRTESGAAFSASDVAIDAVLDSLVNTTSVAIGAAFLNPAAYDLLGSNNVYNLGAGGSQSFSSNALLQTATYSSSSASVLAAFVAVGGGSFTALGETLTGTVGSTTGGNATITQSTLANQGITVNYTYNVATVPEPASMALLGAGLLGLGLARRRKA